MRRLFCSIILGMLHLQSTSVHSVLAPCASGPALIPHLTRSSSAAISRANRSVPSSQLVVGRIYCDKVEPGRYALDNLPSGSTDDIIKIRFCRAVLRGDEDVEVFGPDRHMPRAVPDIDAEPIQVSDGVAIFVVDGRRP